MQHHNDVCRVKLETILPQQENFIEMELDEVVMGVKEMKVADKTSEPSIKIPCKVNSCQECSFISSDPKQLDKHMNKEPTTMSIIQNEFFF